MIRRWVTNMLKLFARHDDGTLAKIELAEANAKEQSQLRRLARSEALDRLFQAALDKPQQGDQRP